MILKSKISKKNEMKMKLEIIFNKKKMEIFR